MISSKLLGPLLKTGLPLIWNLLKPLAKSVLMPLGLTAVASAADAAIHKKLFGCGMCPSNLAKWTTLIISNEKMNDFMKIVNSLEESSLLIKGASETIKTEAKEQKGLYPGMLLGTLGASLLGNLLTGKCTIRAGEDTIRADQDFYFYTLKHKSIIKMNLNLMLFIQEIIYLK